MTQRHHSSPRKWSASLAVLALLAALLPFAALAPATAAPIPGVAAAIQFDGTNDYVTFGDPASLDLAQFTIETWFNRTGNGTAASSGTGGLATAVPLVTHGAPQAEGSNVDADWILAINDTTDVIAADFEDTATGLNHPVSGTTVITNNVWHHAAATYDGTTWRLYLDGNLEATLAVNQTPRSDTIQRAALGTMLPSGTGAAVGFFAGALDEPRVWNRALSAAEIQTGMSQQLTSGSGLVARWGLNEGTATSAADSIGAATGTLTNGPTWVDGGPFTPFAGCQPAVACGIRFDGTNDYVTFGDPASLDLAQFTIETWFNRTGNGTAASSGTGGLATAVPLVTHGAPQAEGSNVDADWILAINDTTDVIAADFEDTATGLNHPVSGTTVITNNVWHHAAATYDGTTWRLYLDGNLEATLAVNQTPRSDTIQRAALGTMLPSGTGAAVGFFAGALDEPRVWNRALSAAEIQTGMSQQLTSGSGLVARWGLNEGTATSAADSIGTATGTLTNGPTWGGGSPFTPFASIAVQLNAPTNGANGVGTSPTLDVTVTDPGNQPLDVTYFARPYRSGNFTQIGTHNGVASGGHATFQWANIGQGQTFEWYVTVDNGPTSITGPTWTFHTAATDPIFVGAGDIADCGRTQDTATGDVLSGIDGTVWTTGDNVYPWGSAANYTNCYDATPWGGATLARTRAIPGNHDWGTSQVPAGQETLANYFAYYGANSQGSGGTSYYGYDIPSSNWHVVNLDSECQLVPGGCGAGSAQDLWLEADLAANSGENVIALWHKPRYSSGVTNYTTMQPLWDDLYNAGVDLMLVGHDHVYERLAPMKSGATLASAPVADPTYGIRQFTVGTGGAALQAGFSPLATSEVRRDDTYGILKLTLHASTYDWQFLPIAGSTFTDAGTGSVHGAPAGPNVSPSAPVLNAPTNAATGVGTSPTLSVHVTDPNADPMTVRFYGRPTGSGVYTLIGTATNVPSGTDATKQWSGLGDGQGYQWYVTLDDGVSALTTGPTWTFSTAAGVDPVFVGVGDIASCASQAQLDAAANTAQIISGIQGTIFTTGDNVYPNGTAAEFTNCYNPSWGAPGIKSRTRPVPGNHDWGTGAQENLTDYFAYFGAAATDAGGKSYYSYDIAGSNWHVVNLDSECQLVPGGCGVGSPQELWLKADLAANSTKNVIAIWHKPRFSSGATNYAAVQPFVDDLYEAGADLVLVGHDHVYERQQPLDPSGNADATYGVSYFTIGTGGESHHGTGTLRATNQVLNNDTYGIMKFTLHANSYDWQFFPEAGKTFTDSGTRSVHGAPGGSARNDFNGDGRSDLLWRNSATGEDYVWFMNGTQLGSSGATLSLADQAWKVAETGDFNGDAKADIVWRNSTTGQVYVWLMDGATIASSGPVFTLADQDWKIVGTGDFDGNGKDDLLWRNATTGQNYVWFLNGTTLASSGALLTLSDLSWKVVGTGDFNGDAKADIAWRNGAGQLYVWLMDGTTLVSHGAVFTLADPNWQVAGVGDYDGNGKDDLLWRNAVTGANYVWFMNGTTLASSGATLALGDLAWKVSGTGDYDGNGKADIAWRNSTTGEVYVWLMDGTTLVSHGSTFVLADANWQIVPSNPPAGALFRVAASSDTEMSYTVSRRGAPKLKDPGHIRRWWHRSPGVTPRTRPPIQGGMTWTVRKG